MLAPTHIVLLGLVLLVALVVFGPKRLPELGQSVGRAIQEFKHAGSQARDEFNAAGAELRSTPASLQADQVVTTPIAPANGGSAAATTGVPSTGV